MNKINCHHCGKSLNLDVIEFVNSRKVSCKCPHCSGNNFLRRTRTATSLQRTVDGSLRRKTPKLKESKKDRKRRRAIERGWAK